MVCFCVLLYMTSRDLRKMCLHCMSILRIILLLSFELLENSNRVMTLRILQKLGAWQLEAADSRRLSITFQFMLIVLLHIQHLYATI